jgi:E3 ubiquitin-protein ligase RNF216
MREFPLVPAHHIRHMIYIHKTLFAAYIALYASEHLSNRDARAPYLRLRKARKVISTPHYQKQDSELEMELELKAAVEAAAKEAGMLSRVCLFSRLLKAIVEARKRQDEIKEAEERNEEEYAKLGALVECQCCFTDTPTNRAISCEGMDIHFFCFKCLKSNAESQIGLMKYEMKCLDMSGCSASFSRDSLINAVSQPVMTKLESLQQQDEIAKADLEGLEDCPFCEFKAICPPSDEDREFRCQNPDCEKVSCRLCKQETHVPKSCEEAKKDAGLPERHLVEEAMTEALIRTCPKCKVKIIKEWGCNKMVCVKCGCSMCYICKKDISRIGYNHFKEGPVGCQVYDQGGDRHQDEVNRAQQDTIKKITTENPHISQDELHINHPDEKKKDDKPRQMRRVPVIIPPPRIMAGNARVNPEPVLPQNPAPYPRPMLAAQGNYLPGAPERPLGRMNFAPMLGAFDPQLGVAQEGFRNGHGTGPMQEDVPDNAAYFLPRDMQIENHGQYLDRRRDYDDELLHAFHHRMNAMQIPFPFPARRRMMNLDNMNMF